jgi:hypothetical protein
MRFTERFPIDERISSPSSPDFSVPDIEGTNEVSTIPNSLSVVRRMVVVSCVPSTCPFNAGPYSLADSSASGVTPYPFDRADEGTGDDMSMVARIAVCVTNAHPRAFRKPSGNLAWSKELVGTRLPVAVRTPQHNPRHGGSYRKTFQPLWLQIQ